MSQRILLSFFQLVLKINDPVKNDLRVFDLPSNHQEYHSYPAVTLRN